MPGNPLARHIRETVTLAVPVTIGRMGILVLIAVDTAMTGHAGADELAYYAVGTAPQVTRGRVGVGLRLRRGKERHYAGGGNNGVGAGTGLPGRMRAVAA